MSPRSIPGCRKLSTIIFCVIPPGQPESPGLIAFEEELQAVDNLAAQSKLDLDKVQIEGILLDIIKTNVMPQFAKFPTKKEKKN